MTGYSNHGKLLTLILIVFIAVLVIFLLPTYISIIVICHM